MIGGKASNGFPIVSWYFIVIPLRILLFQINFYGMCLKDLIPLTLLADKPTYVHNIRSTFVLLLLNVTFWGKESQDFMRTVIRPEK